MTIEQFIEAYNGVYVERYDSSNRNECVDLILQYIDEVMGLANIIPIGVGTAYDFWTKEHKLLPYVDKIDNTLEAIPQKGDIIVWNSTYNGGPGHTAICTGWAGQTQLEVLSQNDPDNVPAVIKRYSYAHIAGWLRPKKTEEDALTACLTAHKEAVDSATKWENKYNELSSDYDTLKSQTDEQIQSLKDQADATQLAHEAQLAKCKADCQSERDQIMLKHAQEVKKLKESLENIEKPDPLPVVQREGLHKAIVELIDAIAFRKKKD